VHSHDGIEFDTPEATPVARSPSNPIHFFDGVVIGALGVLGMVRLFASLDRFVNEPATASDESQTMMLVMAFAYGLGIVIPAAIAVVAATRWACSRLAIQLGGMVLAWLCGSALMDAVSSGSGAAGMLAERSLGIVFVSLFATVVGAVVFVGPVIARQWGTGAWVLLGIGPVIASLVNPGARSGMATASGRL
jgi:hypothetical protein